MGLLFSLGLAAQNDTTFFNADWDTIPSRDGAAYYRLFDKLEDSPKRYRFIDYYISGEKQAICGYSDPKGRTESGEWIWYYINGQISQIGAYKNGYRIGDWYKYFDNGDLKSKLTHYKEEGVLNGARIEYVELYDEINRKHILKNGEGLYIAYFEDGDTSIIGWVSKKVKTGTWKSFKSDGSLFYKEEYKKGVLKTGVSYGKDGQKYTYTILESMPTYEGGQEALIKYIGTIVYPPEAREADIEGTVYVQFVVDKDGAVTDVTVVRSSGSPILDEAAKNHMSKTRKWIPGFQRGIPVKVQYVVPIKFKLS